jgi:hypothetical protein
VGVYQDDQLLIAESSCWLKTRRRPARRRATGGGNNPILLTFEKFLAMARALLPLSLEHLTWRSRLCNNAGSGHESEPR